MEGTSSLGILPWLCHQNTVNALKQQLRQLEVEYRRLERAVIVVEPSLLTAAVKKLPGEPEDNEQLFCKPEQAMTDDENNGATTALTNAYAQLTLLKEELRKENRVLADAAKEHERFQQHVGKCIAADMVRPA